MNFGLNNSVQVLFCLHQNNVLYTLILQAPFHSLNNTPGFFFSGSSQGV